MPTVVLDDARDGRLAVFGEPVRTIAADREDQLPAAFAALEDARIAGRHLAGYVSYELGYLLEDRLRRRCPPHRRVPLLWFGVFDRPPTILEGDRATEFWTRGDRAYAGPLTPAWSEDDYRRRFERVKELIGAGDIFQANLTFQAGFAFVGSPRALHAALRAHGGGARGGYVDDGGRQILSFSPELFVAVDADGHVRAEPMKGTAARGATRDEDAALRERLARSAKDRAENLMIVDLIRSDLGRVATLGSVSVDALFAVETLPTVHQMVSRVSAALVPGTGVEALLRALFPCGSVTGAPKIRAMEVLSDLEAGPRGVYCGAIGHLAPDGSASFNVAIRTVTIEGGRGVLGVGGGVTTDSMADGEWAECLLKARYFERARRPVRLIETLRHQDGRFVRQTLHLRRMEESARVFGIAFDDTAAWRALRGAVDGRRGTLRVRLALEEDGRFTAAAVPFVPWDGAAWSYTLSPRPVSSRDLLLRHKIDWRELYESELARVGAEAGCDEVVFLNERGEVCEGARTNVFARFGDRLLTPAQSCGLLPGCLRREMIEAGRAEEAVLCASDLERADQVMFGNSLRGVIAGRRLGSQGSALDPPRDGRPLEPCSFGVFRPRAGRGPNDRPDPHPVA